MVGKKSVQLHGERQTWGMTVGDDHERFTRLLIRHEPELLRCVLVVVPHRADARDILQECSVALWRRFAEYDSERPFVNWAMGFVRMEVRRFLRTAHRRAQLTERAAACAEEALARAGMGWRDLDEVLMVGGSSWLYPVVAGSCGACS
jgi:DNA-directed RNA polymerase specialized sigma24 family protein